MNLDKELLYRFFNQSATIEEEMKIRQWMEISEENRRELFRERMLFDAILLHEEITFEKEKKGLSIPWRKIALSVSGIAAIILFTVTVTLSYVKQEPADEQINIVTVPQGQRVNLVLADGTNIWLNAKTRMKYPQSFKGTDKRVVEIDGEAYFEVSKNKEKPFVVKTRKGEVEVLGTKFYVSAYTHSDKFETALIEGSVKVHTPVDNLVLTPNHKSVSQNGKLTSRVIEDMDVYRWRDGLYCFKDVPFQEVLKQFEVYYDIRFIMKNNRMPNPEMTGKFRLVDGVDYALRVLQKKVGFTYHRDEEANVIYLE